MDPLKGWPIDLEALYGRGGWKDRARFQLTERVFEAPNLDACLLLYHIGEISIYKEVGRLAAFKDKAMPRLVFDGGRTLFWHLGDESVQWSEDGRLAFVFECQEIRSWFGSNPQRLEIILNVLDLYGERRHRGEEPLDGFSRPAGLDLGALRWSKF